MLSALNSLLGEIIFGITKRKIKNYFKIVRIENFSCFVAIYSKDVLSRKTIHNHSKLDVFQTIILIDIIFSLL